MMIVSPFPTRRPASWSGSRAWRDTVWTGGTAAREMADWLAGKRVECEPAGAAWRCAVDQWDLAEVVVWNGGARASRDASAQLKEAERQARLAARGIWAGSGTTRSR